MLKVEGALWLFSTVCLHEKGGWFPQFKLQRASKVLPSELSRILPVGLDGNGIPSQRLEDKNHHIYQWVFSLILNSCHPLGILARLNLFSKKNVELVIIKVFYSLEAKWLQFSLFLHPIISEIFLTDGYKNSLIIITVQSFLNASVSSTQKQAGILVPITAILRAC